MGVTGRLCAVFGCPQMGRAPCVLEHFPLPEQPMPGVYEGHRKGSSGTALAFPAKLFAGEQRGVPEGSVPPSHCPQHWAGQVSSRSS